MLCPRLRCLGHLVQSGIVDGQQSTLLKVGLCNTPASAQVFIEAIFEQSLKRFLVPRLSRSVLGWLLRVELLIKTHRSEHRLCDVEVLQSLLFFERLEQSGSQQSDLNEVVEMSSLERGVLPIIGEAHQFLSFRLDLAIFAQLDD